jgi:hypothetical protein
MSRLQETTLKALVGTKETMGVGMMTSPNAAVVEYALMKDHDPKSVIGARPAARISKIAIPLNDRETIIVRRTSVDMRHDGCTWRGEIDGTGEPVMIMWWKSGRFTGMLTYRGHIYTLMNMGGEVHAVVETDPGKMPPDHGAMRPQGATQAPSTDVKDDPLVARGEGGDTSAGSFEARGSARCAVGAASPASSAPLKLHRCLLPARALAQEDHN